MGHLGGMENKGHGPLSFPFPPFFTPFLFLGRGREIGDEDREGWVDGLVYLGPAHPSLEPYLFPDEKCQTWIGEWDVLLCVDGAL